MKLRSVTIENFKGIKDLSFELLNLEHTPRELTCIVGDNGSGKTSVLQAIALPLSLATRRIRYAHEFDWHGFLAERISSLGPTRIDLEVEFTADEITITQDLFKKWYDSLSSDFRESKQITAPSESHISDLESRFQRIFPERRFIGTAPKQSNASMGIEDFYFLIQSGGQVYDLAEMSSGEQSVFPLFYEFVRLDINHSIVLIDELELHLHPPEQQRLLRSLTAIGPDCQFIVTTHSSYLTDAIPDEQEVHLEAGTRCL